MKTWKNIVLGAAVLGVLACGFLMRDDPQAPVTSQPLAAAVQGSAPMLAPVVAAAGNAPEATPAPAPAPTLYSVEQAVAQARARGASDDEVYRIRSKGLPAQTIAQLAEREQAEKVWAQRLQAWREARAKLDPSDEAGIRRLREQLFNAEERALLATSEQSTTPQLVLQ